MPPVNFSEAQREVFRIKTGDNEPLGWSPRLREWFGYFTPDESYEAALLGLIDSQTDWLDVGCGHDVFPANRPLAELLSSRCQCLVGVDPSANIDRNDLVHERAKSTIEEYRTDRKFDLVSLRMVAEHIADPSAAMAAFSRLTKPGGRVVIYTVSKWAISSLIAASTPMIVHHLIKRILWLAKSEDTFPTVYRMNTRSSLRRMFMDAGFVEDDFKYLDDCRIFSRWRATSAIELIAQRLLRIVKIPYPDICILGVYRKL